MELKKKADTYNTYILTLSWGQLEAFKAALEQEHADPLSDENLAEISWYMDRVEMPGEDPEEAKAREEVPNPEGDVEGEDIPVAMPPTEGAAEPAEEPPPPTEEPTEEEPEKAQLRKAIKGKAHIPEPGYEPEKEAEKSLPEPPPE